MFVNKLNWLDQIIFLNKGICVSRPRPTLALTPDPGPGPRPYFLFDGPSPNLYLVTYNVTIFFCNGNCR